MKIYFFVGCKGMKKRLILGILIITSVFTLVSCGKKEKDSDTSGSKVTIGNTEDVEDYEDEKDEERENTETQYTEKTFDGFIYSEYAGNNEKNSDLQKDGEYYFNSKYDNVYTEKERLQINNISQNITQALFYGDTYKDKDKTLEYVLSFVEDNALKDNIKIIFKGKFCELIGATYTEDTVKYNTDEIWSGESDCIELPYITTQWTIRYYRYDKYDVKKDEGRNRFDLTFIKKDNRWILTKVETQ